jgi:topoisomerase-4 subunit A
MAKFKLSDVQADAILNMRLRSLRKLEEIEIKKEHKDLKDEQAELEKLLASNARQMTVIKKQVIEIGKIFAKDTKLGARRTTVGKPPAAIDLSYEQMIEKEPVTIVCSDKGWIRSMKGHLEPDKIAEIKYKDGDQERFVFHAETTDKLTLFATNGRFYTLNVDKLPPGRGFGEPIRLMVEMGNDSDIVALFVYDEDRKLLVASDDGRGFIVPEKEVLAQTKNGKHVLTVKGDVEARVCVPADGDHVAVIGTNRKLLIFPLSQVPEMTKGVGVYLQKYSDGGLSDAKTILLKKGLTWSVSGREKHEANVKAWVGERAQAGKLPPNGFARANKFVS